jgi:hypothetical protein
MSSPLSEDQLWGFFIREGEGKWAISLIVDLTLAA